MNLDDVAQFMKFYLDNLNNMDTETEKFDRDIEGNLNSLYYLEDLYVA